MNQVRAWPASIPVAERTPENRVTGWYVTSGGKHWLYVDPVKKGDLALVIYIHSAAAATGKLDKHGEMIFGSMGKMQGGDIVQLVPNRKHSYKVHWNPDISAWMYGHNYMLSAYESDQWEIIPPAKEARK